jgi:hypothetical protein
MSSSRFVVESIQGWKSEEGVCKNFFVRVESISTHRLVPQDGGCGGVASPSIGHGGIRVLEACVTRI